MGGSFASPKLEGARQADRGGVMDYKTIALQCKSFIETMEAQACATDSAIKTQNAIIHTMLEEMFANPIKKLDRKRQEHGDGEAMEADTGINDHLAASMRFNQDSLMHLGRSMVLTIHNFKSISQPVIDAFNVPSDTDNSSTHAVAKHRKVDAKIAEVPGRSRYGKSGTYVDKSNKQQEDAIMAIDVDALKREMSALKLTMNDRERENVKLKELLAAEHESITNVSTQNEHHQREIMELKQRNTKLNDEKGSLQKALRKYEDMEKELIILKRKNAGLENDKEFLRKKVDKLEKSSKQTTGGSWFPSRQARITVTAQVYCPRKGELATSVVNEMSSMLRTQFQVDNMDLHLEVVDKSDIRPDLPAMVICINASRLGTDASNALSNLQVNKTMALVILHHKDVHALPNQSSDRVLTAPEYKRLGGIFDMAFLSGKGMYTCDMNNAAVANIVAFIKQHK